jgi:hypothetical protein
VLTSSEETSGIILLFGFPATLHDATENSRAANIEKLNADFTEYSFAIKQLLAEILS